MALGRVPEEAERMAHASIIRQKAEV
jgi:hypothetical protein